MTPAARTQAAIDLLDQILAAAQAGGAAADTLIQRFFAIRRYAGSKDRRAVRELVYRAIRACGEPPSSGRAAMLRLAASDNALAATFDGSPYGPAPIGTDEQPASAGVLPAWLAERLAASDLPVSEWPALIDRAPLDVRVRRSVGRDTIAARIAGAEPIAGLDQSLRLPMGTDVTAYAGDLEVQDAGSQAVALAAKASSGMTVVDLCAGAGGKTLAIGDEMAGQGRIVACDTDRARLSRLLPRAARADLAIVETRLLDPNREALMLEDLAGAADVVFVDAPCSGTGTWRRNPEARWRLTPSRLARLVETQARLLDVAAALVRPGGALVFVVCSLLDEEGAGQVDRFLVRHPGWRAEAIDVPFGLPRGAGRRLTPALDRTDGFFVARLVAPC